jgi:hypothetical protein
VPVKYEHRPCPGNLHQGVLLIPGLVRVSCFCPGDPGEAHEEHNEQENAGNGNRRSSQEKIRPKPLYQPGHQLQYQAHFESVAELEYLGRRAGQPLCAKDSGRISWCIHSPVSSRAMSQFMAPET